MATNFNLIKKSAMGSAVALALMGGAAPVLAEQGVVFCAAGTGCAGVTYNQFDWKQNTIIIDNGFNNAASATLAGQVLGQGWLSSLNGNVSVTNDRFLYVFSIDASISKAGNLSGDATTFIDGQAVLPTATTATNYFRMYHLSAAPTNADFNAGLPSTGTGSLILEGAVFLDDNASISVPNQTGQTSGFSLGSQTNIDIGIGTTTQGGTKIMTVTAGSGSLFLDVNVTFADTAYFRSDIKALDLDLNLSENIGVPFTSPQRVPAMISGVTPSFGAILAASVVPLLPARFLNNTTCDAGTPPCDMILVANGGGLSTIYAETVPEPTTLALLGLGLLGLGGLARRKRS